MTERQTLGSELAMMLGEIKANVQALREDSSRREGHLSRLELRLDKVEKFNIRIATLASLVVPVVSVLCTFLGQKIINALGG